MKTKENSKKSNSHQELSQEDIDGLDYLVFTPGKIINEVISINGKLIYNIQWDEHGSLIGDYAGSTYHFESLLDGIKMKNSDKPLTPEIKHAIYKSILKIQK